MGDATKGDNRSTDMLAGDALTAVSDIPVLSEHFAWHAGQINAKDGKGLVRDLAVVSPALHSMGALASEARRPLEEVYDRAWREEVNRGSHQEPVRGHTHRQEGAGAD